MAASGRSRLSARVRVPGGHVVPRPAKAAAPRAGRDPEAELWSTFGYDTICLLWGLPLKAVQAVTDAERQKLARVSTYIDGLPMAERDPLVQQLRRASPSARLARFRRIARTLPPVRRTARAKPPARND